MLERLARGQNADHERLDALGQARIINQLHGAPVVAAWDVMDLDSLWLDTLMAAAHELPAKRRRIEAVQKRFKEFERNHPTYGKNLRN